MKKSDWFLIAVGVLAFVTGALTYPYLPAMVASHWNAAGEVNGYMSRAWGAFLFPVIMVIVIALLLAVPHIDPKRNNIAKFRKYYDCLVMTIVVVFYYLYALTLFWNLGYSFDFIVFLVPAFAVLFFAIGMILPRTEPNFMIGIRTPWTISSETVWKKTHKIGGVAFKICGVIALLGIAFPGLAIWFLLGPIIVSAIGLVVYSYVLYEKEKRP
jgi:uncharacterized membrane protein